MSAAYYNEIDPRAAAWLRALIAADLIPAGDVDERSILEIQPSDLDGYSQCHFFAGIGGWPLALQLAGWPATRPVWTGSCPCQPFSIAGKRRGNDDARHLWPVFRALIAECRPSIAFGEQVASADGRLWLAGVRADLEALGYAVGAADLCAAGVGAPHIRQRLYWVANGPLSGQRQERADGRGVAVGDRSQGVAAGSGASGGDSRLAHPSGAGCEEFTGGRLESTRPAAALVPGGLPDTDSRQCDGVATSEGCEHNGTPPGRIESHGIVNDDRRFDGWGDHWIACADGKARRIEPGLSPLAHGVPARVVRLRGYGNAIVPQVAAEFIAAYGEAQEPHQP